MKRENAVKRFENGCNCSQAVLLEYSDQFNIDFKILEQVSVPFGGGMGRQGKTCGCLSGALMVLGLKYGGNSSSDVNARIKSYNMAKRMIEAFENRLGASDCKDLIKLDLSKDSDMKETLEKNIFKNRCSVLVAETISILENFL